MNIETARRVTAQYLYGKIDAELMGEWANEGTISMDWHPETDANQRQMILEKLFKEKVCNRRESYYDGTEYRESLAWFPIRVLKEETHKDLGHAELLCYAKAIEKLMNN